MSSCINEQPNTSGGSATLNAPNRVRKSHNKRLTEGWIMSNRADLVVSYAQRNWAVFPLKPGTKEPGARSGFYAGTDDLVTIRAWWRQRDWNIGIWTGASNLVVIDLDLDKTDAASWNRGGPTPGISWWLEMCAVAEYDWEQTYCVTTASGGLHVYFESNKPYPPGVGQFGALVDVRAGGSYVVGAGSETDVGVFEHCCSDQVQPLPDWLDELLTARARVPVVGPAQQLHYDQTHSFDSSLEGLCRVLQTSVEGERNNAYNWCVWKTGMHWWTDNEKDVAIERLQAVGSAIGLDENEMRDTLKAARSKWPSR
jgi:Bifunctional DNA primase/polymerase, N-terminal